LKKIFNRSLIPLFIFALFCLLLPGVFFGYHLTQPHDGVRLDRGTGAFTPQGVLLSSYGAYRGPFSNEDVLVAVDGILIEERSRSFFIGNLKTGIYETGQLPVYTILRDGELLHYEVELGAFPWQSVMVEHVGVFLFILLAQGLSLFVLLQKKEDPAARAFFIWAFCGSHTYIWAVGLQVSDLFNGLSYWYFRLVNIPLWLLFWPAMIHMLLVFPKPVFSLEQLRPWLLRLYTLPFAIYLVFVAWQYMRYESHLAWWNSILVGEYLVALLFMLGGILLISRHYRHAHSQAERIKIGWVFYGVLISVLLAFSLYILPNMLLGAPFISPNGLGLVNFPFIIALTIAIWRHSLFDIHIIIRRTVVYGLLTALLAITYLSLVTFLQLIISIWGGEQSSFVIVISTLVIAALFNPLRKRIQYFIDRRFYRTHYNAEQALSDFASAARSETNPEVLAEKLSDIISSTVQPEKIDLWINKSFRKL
jgi:hypothetical protein